VLCLKASFGGWVNFIDYRFRGSFVNGESRASAR
jgi:hypothetical protein